MNIISMTSFIPYSLCSFSVQLFWEKDSDFLAIISILHMIFFLNKYWLALCQLGILTLLCYI